MSAHQMPLDTQQELRRMPGNNRCVDCDAPYPQWATVSYGTFMCLECSGRHRGLGVHISFVRSVTMDSWTDKQVLMMQRGGNDEFRQAFAAAGVPTNLSINQKYNTPQAEAYRQRLSALAEGKPAVPLLRWDPSCMAPAASSSSGGSSAGGDTRGVEALKGESEQDYVARQMRLREEARARMAAKFGSGGMQGIGSSGETRAPSGPPAITDFSSAFGYLSSTVTSTVSSAASLVKEQDLGSKVSSSWSYVQSSIADPNLATNVKSTASTGWSALSSGATAVWRTAASVVDTAVGQPAQDGPSAFPRTNPTLSTSGKYSGMGSTSTDNARDHDNDNWLDAQLSSSSSSSPPKANSFGGSSSSFSRPNTTHHSFSMPSSAPSASASSSSSSSSFSTPLTSSAPSSFAPAPTAAPPAPTPAAPAPAPVAEKKPKKDVDFFGEFGF
ncbi:TPA: hypothetical protein N0F65_009099 [Lagenidium giganteum]|uniref:Arf-GAP domain-containing protein n=1 Tax=Lagenidium giganteum TaxID=4803 RepID=A0AAV2YRV2_9STRA|nr:TPA: hypothetical protein N0F65_009099 [Lagenidium giganteum]